jgi:hypothetical protein
MVEPGKAVQRAAEEMVVEPVKAVQRAAEKMVEKVEMVEA